MCLGTQQLVKWTNWITNPGSGQVRPYALAKGFKLHPIGWLFPTGAGVTKIYTPTRSLRMGNWASPTVVDDCLYKLRLLFGNVSYPLSVGVNRRKWTNAVIQVMGSHWAHRQIIPKTIFTKKEI